MRDASVHLRAERERDKTRHRVRADAASRAWSCGGGRQKTATRPGAEAEEEAERQRGRGREAKTETGLECAGFGMGNSGGAYRELETESLAGSEDEAGFPKSCQIAVRQESGHQQKSVYGGENEVAGH